MKAKTMRVVAVAMTMMAIGYVRTSAAHHSFASEFDATRPIQLVGVVKEMRYSNPHSWLYVEVTREDGQVEVWAIEAAAPSALLRRGWNRNSLPPGTEVLVRAFQARDRSNRAAGREVLLNDGTEVLFVGAGGIGAPPGERGAEDDE